MSNEILFISFNILLILSAIYSGSESAFLSSSKLKSHIWKSQKKRNSKRLYIYRENPERYLVSILVGNNFVNIAYTSIGTLIFINSFSEEVTILILVSILLLFGEILPKTLSIVFADKVILYLIPLVRFLELLFYPVIQFVQYLSHKALKNNSIENEKMFSRHDISSLISETNFSIHFNDGQEKYFQNIFKLKDVHVKDIMVPRTDLIALNENSTMDEVYLLFAKGGFSKLPVFKDSIDQITGFVFIYSILQKSPKKLSEVIEKPLYVPENKTCNDLLYTLKRESKSIAIVIDEYGGTAGLVTFQSLLNTIIGTFEVDELNSPQKNSQIIKINSSTYRISGRTKKEDLYQLGLSFSDGDFETIAGMVLHSLGDFPSINQTLIISGYKLTILSLRKNRIQWIKLELPHIEK